MNAIAKQIYDPHLLYHAINITVELEYKVPMQQVYNILEALDQNKGDAEELQIQPNEVVEILNALGSSLEDSIPDEFNDSDSLQSKIKELLRLLGCALSDKELNQILKGELSIDSALSKKAKTAWLMIFHKDKNGRYRPDRDIVENMLLCSQSWALENLELKIQRSILTPTYHKKEYERSGPVILHRDEKLRSHLRGEKERNDPIILDQKRNKLRLYIAHMQGYDRDRDRDGGRGIDMVTGIVIDFGDIYIADKSHGNVIDDKERDGIDMADIH
jgi:hypothetical protein